MRKRRFSKRSALAGAVAILALAVAMVVGCKNPVSGRGGGGARPPAKTFAITFVSGGTTVGTETVSAGASMVLPTSDDFSLVKPASTSTDSKFAGWGESADATLETVKPAGASFSPTKNIILYAVWGEFFSVQSVSNAKTVAVTFANGTDKSVVSKDAGTISFTVIPPKETYKVKVTSTTDSSSPVDVSGTDNRYSISVSGDTTVSVEVSVDVKTTEDLDVAVWSSLTQYSNDTTQDASDDYRRIPAIAETHDGRLIATGDLRYKNWADIYNPPNALKGTSIAGNHGLDVVVRTSEDMGETWSAEKLLTSNNENGTGAMYGDASIVADRESDNILVLFPGGTVSIGSASRNNPQRAFMVKSSDGGKTWTTPVDITQKVLDTQSNIRGFFFTSGRIAQSKIIKVNNFYRIYAIILDYAGRNCVLCSDDFGDTWYNLGGTGDVSTAYAIIANGDEGSVDELPNGDVVVSSRSGKGNRIFAVFKYSNKNSAEGTWDRPYTYSSFGQGFQTNGEIITVKAADAQGKPKYLLLHSIPSGENFSSPSNFYLRTKISIYYKEVENTVISGSSLNGAGAWKGPYLPVGEAAKNALGMDSGNTNINISDGHGGTTPVNNLIGGYSTMIPQSDGRIGFFFESTKYQPKDNKTEPTVLRYLNPTIEKITENNYKTIVWGLGTKAQPYTDKDGKPVAQEIYDFYKHETGSIFLGYNDN